MKKADRPRIEAIKIKEKARVKRELNKSALTPKQSYLRTLGAGK